MSRTISFSPAKVLPTVFELAELPHLPPPEKISTPVAALIDESLEEARELIKPRALYQTLEPEEFRLIFEGEGRNSSPNPIEEIFPRAESLAIFACTIGSEVTDRVAVYQRQQDPLLSFLLDACASAAADRTASYVQRLFMQLWLKESTHEDDWAILRYSPGYCGWHLSGQKKLFQTLRPERIDIRLSESCLMSPMKSVSGVLIAGAKEIHQFSNDYAFCEECRKKSCRARIRTILS